MCAHLIWYKYSIYSNVMCFSASADSPSPPWFQGSHFFWILLDCVNKIYLKWQREIQPEAAAQWIHTSAPQPEDFHRLTLPPQPSATSRSIWNPPMIHQIGTEIPFLMLSPKITGDVGSKEANIYKSFNLVTETQRLCLLVMFLDTSCTYRSDWFTNTEAWGDSAHRFFYTFSGNHTQNNFQWNCIIVME